MPDALIHKKVSLHEDDDEEEVNSVVLKNPLNRNLIKTSNAQSKKELSAPQVKAP